MRVRVGWVELDGILEQNDGLTVFPFVDVTRRVLVVLLLPDVGISPGAAYQKGSDQKDSKKDAEPWPESFVG
jgi:hypothetical protein